jgi:hypothetical protein
MTYIAGGNKMKFLVAMAYLPYDSNILTPSKGLRDVINYCNTNKMQLIIGCDPSAHHIV